MSSSDGVNGDQRLELASRIMDGRGSDADLQKLQVLLEDDAEFRREYLRYANLVSALGMVVNRKLLRWRRSRLRLVAQGQLLTGKSGWHTGVL